VLEDDSADADAESALAEAQQLVDAYGAKLSEAVDLAAIMGEEGESSLVIISFVITMTRQMLVHGLIFMDAHGLYVAWCLSMDG